MSLAREEHANRIGPTVTAFHGGKAVIITSLGSSNLRHRRADWVLLEDPGTEHNVGPRELLIVSGALHHSEHISVARCLNPLERFID